MVYLTQEYMLQTPLELECMNVNYPYVVCIYIYIYTVFWFIYACNECINQPLPITFVRLEVTGDITRFILGTKYVGSVPTPLFRFLILGMQSIGWTVSEALNGVFLSARFMVANLK